MLVIALASCGDQSTEDTYSSSAVNLAILKEEDHNLINNYMLIAVDQDAPFMDADGNAVSDVEINTAEAADVLEAFAMISDGEYTFISRADGSGTHKGN